ncbi:FecCD family ABC transporter permease [Propionispira raffinosivorans]|uniref:FecCD family ABC transporter permease n=1 Tax=Propionispira raffinosivorans TaxID=86959 RepID=UPI000365E30D|nr:iron ABC transporter permease [Propionispira raffinosivorans]
MKKMTAFFPLLFVCFFIISLISLSWGQIDIPFENILAMLCHELHIPLFADVPFTPEQQAVLYHIRMPRTLVGLLVGAGLGASGAVMQGIFSNPLADPGIIGVSSGASVGAVIAIALGLTELSMFYMPLFAFAGALLAVTLTVFLAMRHGRIPVMTLLLSGVVVGMLLGAMTSGILTMMNEQKMQQYLFWTIGGLDYRRWEHVFLAVGPICGGIGVMLLMARHLNILVLGDVEAKAVGMPVMPFRLFLLIIASLTTATGVCVSGNIGFVGLVVPHMMRMLVGPDHRRLLPASIIAGGTFLVLCDTIGRIIMPPIEIRVGVMTAVLGTPYFLYLLRRTRNLSR